MSVKSVVLNYGSLQIVYDLSNYAIVLCFFIQSCRQQIFRSIDILHMHT